MDSRITSVWPSVTVSPSLTSIFQTVPVMCAFTFAMVRILPGAAFERNRQSRNHFACTKRCEGGRCRVTFFPRTSHGGTERVLGSLLAQRADEPRGGPHQARRCG